MDWKKFLNYRDIRFWLILLALVRLYAITLPPLEHQHPWRQTDGLMIARNFVEVDANIMYPRVDIAGEKTGITGSEFPLLNYLIYLVSAVFGYEHWYGRLIVLIVSTLGSFFFYKAIRIHFNETVAFNATLLLTCSFWFSYSRKIFPDCFSAGLCLMALYFVLSYLEGGKPYKLILYLLFASLGCLTKISSTLLLSVLIVPIGFMAYSNIRKIWVIAASVVVLAFTTGWYFVWVPHLNATYGYGDHFTSGCPLFSMGWEEIKANYKGVLRSMYIIPMKYTGLVALLCSLIYVLWKRRWIVFSLFIIPYVCFLVIILKTGKSIMIDQYYVLCVIPCIAFIAGYALSEIRNRWIMYLFLLAVIGENLGDQIYDFRAHKMNAPFANLESIVDTYSKRDDLFVINSAPHCPTVMYFAHRRGWTVMPDKLRDAAFMSDVKAKGCKFVLVCKEMFRENFDVVLDLPMLYESDAFRIYALSDGATVATGDHQSK
ncbi:glycosyltransferase family 39 protein [Chryseolinea sp. T2]|uniref:ArnT family glycosyltransferase n=1 Tax=Chryseolinea sp. T2 TaxID=3129255 RepID=UPI0030775F60